MCVCVCVWTGAVDSALNCDTFHTVKVKGVGVQAVKVSGGEDAWFRCGIRRRWMMSYTSRLL